MTVRDSRSSRRATARRSSAVGPASTDIPVGILGNNGVIHPKAAEKAGQFIQLCNQIDVPLVFIQNITGYMVGKDAEAEGIIKKGSQMLNAVTNSTVPHLTVIIGSSYGAGTYGMSGRAFNNRFTFLWPTAKIAVMGPKQIAGVMCQVRRGQAERKGVAFDEEEDAKIVAMVEEAQEQGSLALAATGAVSDDGIIDPRDTRTVLGLCLSVVRSSTHRGRHQVRGLPPVTIHHAARRQPRRDRAARHSRRARRWGCAPSRSSSRPTRTRPSSRDADEARFACRPVTSTRRPSLAARTAAAREAIHPGYGFLSENAELRRGGSSRPDSCGSGRRHESSRPWATSWRPRTFALACGRADTPLSENPRDANDHRLPAHGQGRCRRRRQGHAHRAHRRSQLDEALDAARREALSRFRDDRVFLERYVERSRHVEIQILGDRTGTSCTWASANARSNVGIRSWSRSHLRRRWIDRAASADGRRPRSTLARAIGYESAGTVEFLVDDETREFYFLEVNTRLQVEHPVTEEVTGIDLVREQLRLAQGEELGYGQDDIRFYAVTPSRCVSAPKIPRVGFLAGDGHARRLRAPARAAPVRWESGVEQGSVVTVDFDPLLAKVISHAPTRVEAAAAALALALERLHLGGVTTNRDFLAATSAQRALPRRRHHDRLHRAIRPASDARPQLTTNWRGSPARGALWLQGRASRRRTSCSAVSRAVGATPASRASTSHCVYGEQFHRRATTCDVATAPLTLAS